MKISLKIGLVPLSTHIFSLTPLGLGILSRPFKAQTFPNGLLHATRDTPLLVVVENLVVIFPPKTIGGTILRSTLKEVELQLKDTYW